MLTAVQVDVEVTARVSGKVNLSWPPRGIEFLGVISETSSVVEPTLMVPVGLVRSALVKVLCDKVRPVGAAETGP